MLVHLAAFHVVAQHVQAKKPLFLLNQRMGKCHCRFAKQENERVIEPLADIGSRVSFLELQDVLNATINAPTLFAQYTKLGDPGAAFEHHIGIANSQA
jgi:hypothetical protein